MFAGNDGFTHHDQRRADDACDGHNVAREVEIELVVERRIDRVSVSDQEQRIAVRCRAHNNLSADIAISASPILDDELLAEPLRKPLPHQASCDVSRAARRVADDQMHRSHRIYLRPCYPR